MARLLHVLCATMIMVAVITSCGGSAQTPSSRSLSAVFPVTIMRTGGIAGFRDVLVVAGDGLVSVTRKGHSQQRCRLTPAALERLTRAATQLPWARVTPAGTDPSFPDDMLTTVQSPAGGPVRLEDPLVGRAGAIFVELVNNLNDGPQSSRLCAPV